MPFVTHKPRRQSFAKHHERQNGPRIYASREWMEYSQWYRRNHPLCVRCGELSECVDHIIAVFDTHNPLFMDANNHQSLCTSCHSKKTVRREGGERPGRQTVGGGDKVSSIRR